MFNGNLYDARVYDYALSASQVQYLASKPALTINPAPGGKVIVTWPAAAGAAGYVLQSTTNLSSGWSIGNLPVVQNGTTNMVTDTVGSGATFYRLVEQ